MNRADRRQLMELFGQARDGSADDAALAELERRLATDDEALRLYLSFTRLHASLARRRWAGDGTPDTADDFAAVPEASVDIAPAGSIGLTRWALAVAAVVLVALTAWVLVGALDGTDHATPDGDAVAGDAPPAEPVAVVTGVSDAVWLNEPLAAGADVTPRVLAIESGAVSIDFHDGTSVLLRGPAEVFVDANNRVALHAGYLEAVANPGFAVDLPGGIRVTDLSTSFEVWRYEEGPAGLRVREGAVRVDALADDGSVRRSWVVPTPPDAAVDAEPLPLHVYPESLVALWRFDGSDPTENSAGAPVPLAASGDPAHAHDEDRGGVLRLDGADDALVATGPIDRLPAADAPYTIAAWIRPTRPSGGIVGWGRYETANMVTALRLSRPVDPGGANGLRHFWWGNDLDVDADAALGVDLYDGAWHHVAATYDGQRRRLWIDGRLAAEDTPRRPHNAANVGFAIGRTTPDGTEFFGGFLDDVAVFDRALDASEIDRWMRYPPAAPAR